MKSETIKFFLDCYLREDCFYDCVDGVEYCPKQYEHGSQAGESETTVQQRFNEFNFCEPQHVEPLQRYDNNAPLNQVQEQQIRQYARLLRSFSNDFEQNIFGAIGNQNAGSVVIQFKQRSLFVSSNSKIIHIPVIRKGDMSKINRLKWKTSDETAVSGHNYVGGSGEITFAENEVEKMITIEILAEFEEDKDYRFRVSLEGPEHNVIGIQNLLTVCIVDHDNFYDEEKQVVENMLRCNHSHITDIVYCLHDHVTSRTFHTALQYICSNAHSVPEELALAFQLTNLTLRKVRRMSLYEVVTDFFRTLPELEDIGQHFVGFH